MYDHQLELGICLHDGRVIHALVEFHLNSSYLSLVRFGLQIFTNLSGIDFSCFEHLRSLLFLFYCY